MENAENFRVTGKYSESNVNETRKGNNRNLFFEVGEGGRLFTEKRKVRNLWKIYLRNF